MIIEQNMKYSKHVQHITSKIKKLYNKLKSLRNNKFGFDGKKKLYFIVLFHVDRIIRIPLIYSEKI